MVAKLRRGGRQGQPPAHHQEVQAGEGGYREEALAGGSRGRRLFCEADRLRPAARDQAQRRLDHLVHGRGEEFGCQL